MEKCQYCGETHGEMFKGFISMGLPDSEMEEKINKWGRSDWWERMEDPNLSEEDQSELQDLCFYDQIVNTVGKGVACIPCLQKEDELIKKYYG